MNLPFPLRGVHENSAVSEQPPGTSPLAVNVRGYDLVTRRDRGCQRVGQSKSYAWTNPEAAAIDQIRSAFLGPEVITGGIHYVVTAADLTPSGDGQHEDGTLATHPDGSSSGLAGSAGNYYQSAYKLWGVSSGRTVMPPSNPPAIFAPGQANISFIPNQPLDDNFNLVFEIAINIGAGSLALSLNVDFSDFNSDTGDYHYVQILVKRTTVELFIRKPGATSEYSHTYNLASAIPSGLTRIQAVVADNGFIILSTLEPLTLISHTYTKAELSALGTYTTQIAPYIALSATNPATGNLYDNIFIGADAPPANQDVVGEKVCVASGGQIFTGDVDNGWTECDASSLTDGSGNAYITANEISLCAGFGFFWLVDGQMALRRIDAVNDVITEPSATAGTLPTGARLLALYRGRLFHSRFTDDSFNYIASRSGDLLDYDEGQTDPDGAFAGNDTQYAGLIGDTVTAMVPYGDVSMIMGMASSIAVMRGDPKAGGSIDMLSREVGVAGPTAWARSPDGDFFFMARDGLYRISGDATNRMDLYGGVASAQPKPMSRGRLDRTLGQIDFTTTKVAMCWDPLELGLKILLIPGDLTQPITSVFWEQRKDAFWIDTLPFDTGPNCAEALRGSGGPGGVLLLGGRDGYLRHMDASAADDDGTAITSSVRYAPIMPLGDMVLAKIQAMRLLWGTNPNDSPFNAIYSLAAANDPVGATANADAATWAHQGTITQGGYQSLDRQRSRGNSFIFQIDNAVDGSAWAIERGSLLILPTGRVRA